MVNSTRLQIPLQGKFVWATRENYVWADLTVQIWTYAKTWNEFVFRVDSGSEMSTMPASLANEYSIPIPKDPTKGIALKAPGGPSKDQIRPVCSKLNLWDSKDQKRPAPRRAAAESKPGEGRQEERPWP